MRRGWIAAVTLVALVGTSVAIQVVRDRLHPRADIISNLLYIQSGSVLRTIALSYDALLADVYWIRAVQHFGSTRRSADPAKKYGLLYPLLDITTTLDPSFNIAYRFGAIFLAEPFPGGAGRPDLAVRLLEKGIAARPDRWRYHQDVGFVYYWWLRDYKTAAAWFQKASEVPGAPWWLRSLAAASLTEGGERRGARLLWQQMAQTADNDWLMNEAARRLRQLDALDQIDALQSLVSEFTRRSGLRPESWHDLVRAGFLRGTPADPAGEFYELDPQTGTVTVSPRSPLSPLPQDPKGP